MEEIVSSRYSSGAFNRFFFLLNVPFGEQNNVKNVNIFGFFFSFSKSSGKLGTQMRTYDGSISSLTHPISRALVNGKTKSCKLWQFQSES